MNELLQKHGCSNVFTVPEGLRELMGDITREVLRQQPVRICDFIANYLSALLITREHGILAVRILDDLCDCRPTVSEHLIKSGMAAEEAAGLSEIIKDEIENTHIIDGKEKVKEAEILKKILKRNPLDEEMTAKVCQIARNAYRDYWYRKKLLEQEMKEPKNEELWEKAAANTLDIYKKTRPSFSELSRATLKIQAAYRGYHVRRQMLGLRKPKKKQDPKVDLLGPPVDIAESRQIDLGPVVDIKEKVKIDDMSHRFTEKDSKALGLDYDTAKTITDKDSKAKKSVKSATMDASVKGGVKLADHDNEDELPLALDLVEGGGQYNEDRRISFGPARAIEVPEDLPMSAPTSGTNSVPTSGATTAATSDIEDIATSGNEEEE